MKKHLLIVIFFIICDTSCYFNSNKNENAGKDWNPNDIEIYNLDSSQNATKTKLSSYYDIRQSVRNKSRVALWGPFAEGQLGLIDINISSRLFTTLIPSTLGYYKDSIKCYIDFLCIRNGEPNTIDFATIGDTLRIDNSFVKEHLHLIKKDSFIIDWSNDIAPRKYDVQLFKNIPIELLEYTSFRQFEDSTVRVEGIKYKYIGKEESGLYIFEHRTNKGKGQVKHKKLLLPITEKETIEFLREKRMLKYVQNKIPSELLDE